MNISLTASDRCALIFKFKHIMMKVSYWGLSLAFLTGCGLKDDLILPDQVTQAMTEPHGLHTQAHKQSNDHAARS